MSYYIIGLLLSLMSWACSDDVETGREEIPVETDGGYLFAHMTNANYGKLYYAASRSGENRGYGCHHCRRTSGRGR